MNKEWFINELSKKAEITIERAIAINDILEEKFTISKDNKEKLINNMMEKLKVTYEEANNYYNISSDIITQAIKERIKHPFKTSKN